MSMPFRCRLRVRAGLIAALALALSGCASPEPTYFSLQPLPGAIPTADAHIIELRRPGLPGYLDRADVVLKNADYRLHVNSQMRWAEPIGDMIGRVLLEDLGQRLPASTVFGQGGAITADADLRIEIDVQRFDQGADNTVTLIAEVALEIGRGHTPAKTLHISLQSTPTGPDVANLVAIMSGLLARAADQIAQDVTRTHYVNAL